MQLSISLKCGLLPNFPVLMTFWIELFFFFLLRYFSIHKNFLYYSCRSIADIECTIVFDLTGKVSTCRTIPAPCHSSPFFQLSLLSPHLVIPSHNTPQTLTFTKLIHLLQIKSSKKGRITFGGKLF